MSTELAYGQPSASDTDPYSHYRAHLLSAQRVRELSALRPHKVLFDVALNWVAILLAWQLVAVWPAWWTVLIAIPVIGTRCYALFIIGHDGMHRRLFSSKRLNDLFNDLFIFGPIGAVTHVNNRNHLEHHLHLASTLDPDRHKHACFNKTEHEELVTFLSGLSTVWKNVKNVFLSGSLVRQPATPLKHDRENYTPLDMTILVLWFALLAGGLTWKIGWWAFPLLWLLPVYLFMVLGDNFRSFAEHSHPESDEQADKHRLLTYDCNVLERVLVAPMNMNYHATHHLWPSIPYYNLPQADREIRQMPAAKTLEWRSSYFAYLQKYNGRLPLIECKQHKPTAQALA